jgi:AcrR family transcriptional regulator
MSPTRRELVRATRARIVEAAGRLVRERGASGFSMDVLAKEAGVARATVYEHFRSKRAVLDELASGVARTIVLDEQRANTADPVRALREMFSDVCRHWSEHEEHIRGMRSITVFTGAEPSADGVDDRQLAQLVSAIAASGSLRAGWAAEDAVDALATLTSYATYERLRRGPRSPDQVEAVLVRLAEAVVDQRSVPTTV